MMKLIVALSLGLSAIGCGAGFDRLEMSTRLHEEQPIFTDDDDVLKIEQLRPQITLPFRLAVVPPPSLSRVGIESGAERSEILAWGEKLKQAGIVSEFTVLPDMLLNIGSGHARGSLKSIRVAAARLGADAVLILRSVTDTDSSANAWCLLDITIVGMFVLPGHHQEALTIVEGVIIDNRNQFLYVAASAEGTASETAPLVFLSEKDAAGVSRRAALRSFGDHLVQEGQRLRAGRKP